MRWFREDRIESVELTAETAPRRELADFGTPPADAPPGRAGPGPAPGGRDGAPAGRAARGQACPGVRGRPEYLRCRRAATVERVTIAPARIRLTQYAHGGGCACKIPPGELEAVVAGLTATGPASPNAELVVGLDDGDDAAVVRIAGGQGLVLTTDFFTPVVDDAYTFGRIAAANALSDVYAMGGTPVVAVNLLGWPRDVLPAELAAEVLRGGLEVAQEAGCHVGGGHSIDDPEPKYGMAVTGLVDLDRIIRNDAAVAGTALSLTKPLGVGVLNSRMKATGEVSEEAVASMTALNRRRRAGRRRRRHPGRHRRDRVRPARAPLQDGAGQRGHRGGRRRRRPLPDRRPPGAGRRVRLRGHPPQPRLGAAAHRPVRGVARTRRCCWPTRRPPAGCCSAARCPGAPVIGEFVPRGEFVVVVR